MAIGIVGLTSALSVWSLYVWENNSGNSDMTLIQDIADIGKPVFRNKVPTLLYINRLEQALKRIMPANDRKTKLRYNHHLASIRILSEFLKKRGTVGINPNEGLLTELQHYCQKRGIRAREPEKVCSHIRILTNTLPSIQRRILTPTELQRLQRFDHLTPGSQKAIDLFLRDGRKTKLTKTGRLLLRPQLLAARTRKSTINDLGRFLKTVEQKDVLQITEEDAEHFLAIYDRQGKRDTALHCLADTNPFYRNLVARGVLQNNPLANYADKPSTVNRDYVPQRQIDKLMDLSETDALCLWDVRNRLIVALAYDFALRACEIESLNESDVLVDDYVRVRLASNIQKGGRKPEQVLSNYFPETKVLMNLYLELRRRYCLATDALLISEKGRRLQGTGIRNAVRSLCSHLKVNTYEGNMPAPHRFRHSFGTLNISCLGLKLDPYAVMTRLRHNDISTTLKIYVAENPLLNQAQHDAFMRSRTGQSEPTVIAAADTSPKNIISEISAMKLLKEYGFTVKALRKYAQIQNAIEKRNGKHFYSLDMVERLVSNYFTKQETMRLIGCKKSAMYEWIQNQGIEIVVVGKTSLVPKDDVMRRVRG